MVIIKRRNGLDENFDNFESQRDALNFIKENVGIFNSGEVVALIDYESMECNFVELRLTVTPVFL